MKTLYPNLFSRSLLLPIALTVCSFPGRGLAAANRHGLSGGNRVLFVNAGGVLVNLTPGSGFVDDNAYNNATAGVNPARAASSIYYCYVQNTGVAGYNGNFNPNKFTFVCVNGTSPVPDGHPSAAISDGTGGYGVNTNALFVGSYITDSNSNLVPFYRNGDQVILTPTNNDVGGAIDPGVNDVNGHFAPGAGWAWTSFSPSLLPASASAAILDIFLDTFNNNPDNFCILDPNQVPGGGGVVKTCQGQQLINGSDNPGTDPAYANYRIEANFDSNGKVWVGTDASKLPNPPPGNLYYTLVYRGYVEPVNHLLPR